MEFGELLIGLLAVIGGAELVVRGGSRVAARFGISPMVIGVTIVAIGTSAPELAIGIDAAARGSGSLAIGNIAGTNALNVLFILGLVALLRPVRLHSQTLKLDLPVIVVASILMLLLTMDGTLSRPDGAILLSLGAAYTVLIVRAARREAAGVRREFAREYGATKREVASTADLVRNVVWLVAGLAVIVVGADWLVDGAVKIARGFGVSETVIGLTIVAIGTSAPELVTAIVATLRKERDIAIGNLLGSTIYNIVFVLGTTALIPSGGIPVDAPLIAIDIPFMVAASIACVPVFLSGHRIRRLEGAAFVTAYLIYLTYLLVART
ncbi:calcium/sodium antiporter [Cryobacterium sp. PH31-AA6]|uniref:calcium/sodium antiporter n=1 Tax=Cryobacterium sp. PH31-AA6 TaxID=3046205 RepID=UPI0024B8DA2D|nr:calcium/sodium antiporter [Cryobacterium sp. PH31-AA6]MDJ0324471.1 calcium/sodium antiporter [Cryobacterium sp. PH31-AA6]